MTEWTKEVCFFENTAKQQLLILYEAITIKLSIDIYYLDPFCHLHRPKLMPLN